MYDVIIIGAGTAGLMAAQQLKGKFLVLDSKKEIGYPLRCGEGIRERVFLQFFKHTNYPFVKNHVSEHVVIANNLKRSIKENYIQMDKPKFEQWLAAPLKEHIKLRQPVTFIKKTKQYVEIYSDKEVFKAKLAIIATGSAFILQKHLGLCSPKKETVLGYGGLYKNYNLEKNKFYFISDNKYAGYFWVFPKTKEIANIGFGALNTNNNVKECFNQLLKKYTPNATCIQNYTGFIDCTGPIKKTYAERILVCGGAAGLVHATSGEGISYALISGKIAGAIAQKAIQKNNCSVRFLQRYEYMWKKSIGKELLNSLDMHLLMRLAFKYNVAEQLFREPTDEEARAMLSRGILPRRAQLAVKLIKLFGLYTQDLTKKTVSPRLRIAYRLGKLLSH